jgi:hypothetical protein
MEKTRQCLSLILQLYGYKLSYNPTLEVIECLLQIVSSDKSSLQRRALRVIKAAINNGAKIDISLDLLSRLKKSEDREVAELAKDLRIM